MQKESYDKIEEQNINMRKKELELQLLARKPLFLTINDHRVQPSIDKYFSNVELLIDYLSYPIEKLMRRGSKQLFSQEDSIMQDTLLNQSFTNLANDIKPTINKMYILLLDKDP